MAPYGANLWRYFETIDDDSSGQQTAFHSAAAARFEASKVCVGILKGCVDQVPFPRFFNKQQKQNKPRFLQNYHVYQ
jgi:hypothetical protein